ncbi:MAG: hypothetical protein E7294_10850 [Lachnospiraceae bacterium]|nr:hypothetical protein [Lachnospiraceae bacterium]
MDIIFSIDEVDLNEITGFELGNISINKNELQCTSLNRIPDQSMMIFITISQLLNQIRSMIEKKEKTIIINGVDSSYWIKIQYVNNLFIVSDDRCCIKKINPAELIETVYIAALKFWEKYGNHIESDSVHFDFKNALEEYEICMKRKFKLKR